MCGGERIRLLGSALLMSTLAHAGTHSSANTAADPASVAMRRELVASGLAHPWGIAFLDRSRALVTEKDGGLWMIDLESGHKQSVTGLPSDLDNVRREPRDNAGLFDVALDPQFGVNRRVFFSYASKDRDDSGALTTTKLVSARLQLFNSEVRIDRVTTWFEALPRSSDRFHYGGGLLIKDDYLYLTVGERHYLERDNPALPVAQDAADSRGKIYRFRLTPDPSPPQRIAMGIRAAQGLAVQPGSGKIWFTDHGPSGGDELNILRIGANYGWPIETFGRYREEWHPPRLDGRQFELPVFYWADRVVAPTGLTFLSGKDPAFAEWRGDLLVAGLRRGYLMRIDVDGDRVLGVDYLLEDAPVRLRNVKEAPDGRVYILTDESDGKVIRLLR